VSEPHPTPAAEQEPVPDGASTGQVQATEQVHHYLVQAPVPAMDVDGFNVTILGLIAFAVGTVVTAIFYSALVDQGRGWWLGVCVSGVGLGFIGLAYCLYRRSRRRAGRWDRD
jgi:hypothetical protein